MRTRRSASSSSDPMPSSQDSNFDTNVSNDKSEGHRPPGILTGHTSVLLHECIDALAIKPTDFVLDATLGGAGHARAIVEKLGAGGTFIGIDADVEAVERARVALHSSNPRIFLATSNFRNLSEVLRDFGITGIDAALFDLGWSGYQMAAGRGFSFQSNEPLLMTYSKDVTPETLTAEKIVNEWEEESIADVLYGWGEERFSRRIAKRIIEYRANKRIMTSGELAGVIAGAIPKRYRESRLHPATKTFQALRIAVNDEIGALKDGLYSAWERLKENGRLAVVSFHSIEDREVKRILRAWSDGGEGRRITRSPIRPTREETRDNPRSRSAKLRVIEKSKYA